MNSELKEEDVILELRNVTREYPVKKQLFKKARMVRANDDVSFKIKRGKTLAIIGESGCGKTTLAKQILGIENPDQGKILFQGKEIQSHKNRPHSLIKAIQLVFQNPYSSLNPRQKIQSILDDPLKIHTNWSDQERNEKIDWIMGKTGLSVDFRERYPHMFSGGQRQRIAIARALILNPELLVLDEPVSALDLSVRAQVINLLKDLQEELNLTYLFISHDISLVQFFADELLVMYLGQVVEQGEVNKVLTRPSHPYTRALVSASPTTRTDLTCEKIKLKGEIPSLLTPPTGCRFHPRCHRVLDQCSAAQPELLLNPEGGAARCINPEIY